MAVQKNFVVKNGIEVNTNLIFGDTGSNKVGIATTNPRHTLHVNGGIGVTNLTASGISTVNNLTINGRITAGSSLGASGQYLVSTGAGVSWANIPKIRLVDKQIATANQTTFSTVYTVGLLDVYINGVRLSEDEFTAINAATVTLDDACFGGETVEFISYSPSSVSVGQTGISGITVLEEGTPVGSPLLVTSINFVGASVTAVGSGIGVTVYLSDYVASSGVSTYASTAGIATYSSSSGTANYSLSAGIATYATNSGIATYATFSGIATYSSSAGVATYADSSGISTVSQGLTGTPNIEVGIVTATNVVIGGGTTQLIVTGDARVTGILTIGTSSITLNGLSNTINVGSGVTIDGNAGIISATSIFVGGTTITGGGVTSITAGSGISVDQSTGNVTITATGGGGGGSSQWVTTAAGIHTLSSVGIGTTNATSALTVKENTSLETLNVSGVSTFNNTVNFGPGGYISTSANNLNINASTDVVISGYSGGTKITSQPGANLVFVDAVGGDVSLYYQTSAGPSGSEKRLQTLGTGVTVTGTTFTNQLSVSGVSTFAGIITSTKTGDNGATFNSTAGQAYVVLNSDTNFTSFLDFKENGTLKGNIAYSPTGSGALEINSASNRNVVIATGGGNVGINTTNPLSGYNLTVGTSSGIRTDSLKVYGYGDINGLTIKGNSSGYNDNVIISQHPATSFAGNRNIAIGDYSFTTPGASGQNVAIGYYALNVVGNNDNVNTWNGNIGVGAFAGASATTTLYNTFIGNDSGRFITTGGKNTLLGAYDGNSKGLDIRTSSNNVVLSDGDGNIRFYANSSGNVGLGTTNPTSKLTVRGGDISVGVSTAHGVILTSPNGTQYRLIVDDSGTLSTVAV